MISILRSQKRKGERERERELLHKLVFFLFFFLFSPFLTEGLFSISRNQKWHLLEQPKSAERARKRCIWWISSLLIIGSITKLVFVATIAEEHSSLATILPLRGFYIVGLTLINSSREPAVWIRASKGPPKSSNLKDLLMQRMWLPTRSRVYLREQERNVWDVKRPYIQSKGLRLMEAYTTRAVSNALMEGVSSAPLTISRMREGFIAGTTILSSSRRKETTANLRMATRKSQQRQ